MTVKVFFIKGFSSACRVSAAHLNKATVSMPLMCLVFTLFFSPCLWVWGFWPWSVLWAWSRGELIKFMIREAQNTLLSRVITRHRNFQILIRGFVRFKSRTHKKHPVLKHWFGVQTLDIVFIKESHSEWLTRVENDMVTTVSEECSAKIDKIGIIFEACKLQH